MKTKNRRTPEDVTTTAKLALKRHRTETFQAHFMNRDGQPEWRVFLGYPLEHPDLPDTKFFVDQRRRGRWVVTERWTGQRIGPGGETRTDAILAADQAIASTGPLKIRCIIADAIATNGQSPSIEDE